MCHRRGAWFVLGCILREPLLGLLRIMDTSFLVLRDYLKSEISRNLLTSPHLHYSFDLTACEGHPEAHFHAPQRCHISSWFQSSDDGLSSFPRLGLWCQAYTPQCSNARQTYWLSLNLRSQSRPPKASPGIRKKAAIQPW